MFTNLQNQLILNYCSEHALTMYIVGISLGGRQGMFTKRLVDSVVRRGMLLRPHALSGVISALSRSDTRTLVYVVFLRGTDVCDMSL